MSHLHLMALLVPDYDIGIEFFVETLGFDLIEDTPRSPTKRWVVVRPKSAKESGLLLAKAVGEEQVAAIGRQHGGRVGFFLHTDDFERDHAAWLAAGVHFTEEPRHEEYGTVVVFADPWGNKWDLIEPAGHTPDA